LAISVTVFLLQHAFQHYESAVATFSRNQCVLFEELFMKVYPIYTDYCYQ